MEHERLLSRRLFSKYFCWAEARSLTCFGRLKDQGSGLWDGGVGDSCLNIFVALKPVLKMVWAIEEKEWFQGEAIPSIATCFSAWCGSGMEWVCHRKVFFNCGRSGTHQEALTKWSAFGWCHCETLVVGYWLLVIGCWFGLVRWYEGDLMLNVECRMANVKIGGWSEIWI